MDELSQQFCSESVLRMEENLPRIKKCLDMISEEELWQSPNESSNTIGNLILHLCGNIRQYIICGLGGEPDNRQRDTEFTEKDTYTREKLFIKLSETVLGAVKIIRDINKSELTRKRTVQGFTMSVTGIIIHVVEHFSYHTGQIALLTKLLKNKDLGFYSGIDLNIKNK